jgi:hypothetical protein
MAKTTGGILLGLFWGVILGAVISWMGKGDGDVYSRHVFCAILGAGFGGVAGAIAGAAAAIADALNREKPSR